MLCYKTMWIRSIILSILLYTSVAERYTASDALLMLDGSFQIILKRVRESNGTTHEGNQEIRGREREANSATRTD